jgi:hypothetical protein
MMQKGDLNVRTEPDIAAFPDPDSARAVPHLPPNSALEAGFTGVAIRLVEQPGAKAGERVEIVLAHADRSRDAVLYAADHSDDVIAEWQAWAERLSLPLMLENADGVLEVAFPQLGALRIGTPRPRRRKAILAGRRPRFLTRRKTGTTPQRPKVLRGAHEIIARS